MTQIIYKQKKLSGAINKQELVDMLYPVGSIYISTISTNPSTTFGGTWVSFGAGKTLVGVDSNDEDFDESNKTGGTKTVTLTEDQMPKHKHDLFANYANIDADPNWKVNLGSTVYFNYEGVTKTAGNDEPHENMPPYITVYMWKRTA